MTITNYFAGTNLVIAFLCLGAVAAVAMRAETPFLRVAVVCVLLFEFARNALSGWLRLYDPTEFTARTQAEIFAVLNTLLIIGMALFIVATLRLERPAPSVEKKLNDIDEKVTEVRDAVVDEE